MTHLRLILVACTASAGLALWSEASAPLALAADASNPSAAVPATPSPSADPAAAPVAVTSLSIETGQADKLAVLRGREARQQLVVTGVGVDGSRRDLTRQVQYKVEPEGVVQVDATGMVLPVTEGRVKVTAATPEGVAGVTELGVEGLVHETPVNFPNQIVPIFTKLGCNSGGCHGKASGQNGFRLSLLGFEPTEDFEHLVKEARGRRVFPAAPDRSLLLTKPINAMPHGGGQRMDRESHEYRLIRRWLAQGMPYGKPTDPVVQKIEVFPPTQSMSRKASQQIVVLAHYSDGSIEDVTRTAKFESNDTEMAEATNTGLVKTLDLAGDVAVMARYQGQVSVFRASIPLGAPTDKLPAPRNFVDEFVLAKLKMLGVPASAECDDSTFIRRVTVDIAGRLPTIEETRQFLADATPTKRDGLIERLLASDDYADYFANKWNAVLRNRRRNPNQARGTFAFHDWIRESLAANKPYDKFVREILAASGDVSDVPAVNWYREVKEVEQQVEDSAQLFLGLRIQCSRCHHHPFEKWSQRDYYSFAAFFSQVGRKPGESPDETRIYHKRGPASATNPKTGEKLKPAGLDGPALDLPADRDPRQSLVDWMSSPDNRFFAPALVNRYWKHFFGRGIVDPEDDMRVTNPATNPELIQALSKHFVQSGFDLKELVRTICQSRVYQFSSEPNEYNLSDKKNFSRYYPKRLTAEVLLDAIDVVTQADTGFSGMPTEFRAVQLPDTSVDSYFLTVFGRPESSSACECERSQEANLAQSLHLLNSAEVQGKLSAGDGRAARLAKDAERSPEDKIRDVYLAVFARGPVAEELAVAAGHVSKSENKQQAYEDILWALVNTKEFLFNH